ASKNTSNEPRVEIAASTMAVNPAAGPETLNCELLKVPTTIPPMIPDIIPENKGAPLANAIPKHKGRATKKTTSPDLKSVFKYFKLKVFIFFLYQFISKMFYDIFKSIVLKIPIRRNVFFSFPHFCSLVPLQ